MHVIKQAKIKGNRNKTVAYLRERRRQISQGSHDPDRGGPLKFRPCRASCAGLKFMPCPYLALPEFLSNSIESVSKLSVLCAKNSDTYLMCFDG